MLNQGNEQQQTQTANEFDDFLTGWDVGVNEESGEYGYTPRQTATSPPPTVDQVALDKQTEAATNITASAKPSPELERIGKLEGIVSQLIGFLAGNQSQQQQQQQQPQYDLTDQNDLAKFIVDTVQKSVSASIQPVMQVIPQLSSRTSYIDAQMRYGEDFTKMLPAIQVLMESDTNLTFDAAYRALQAAKGAAPNQPAQTYSTPSQVPAQKQGDASALIAKATNLRTEQGISNVAPKRGEPTTVRDALMEALHDLRGGAGH